MLTRKEANSRLSQPQSSDVGHGSGPAERRPPGRRGEERDPMPLPRSSWNDSQDFGVRQCDRLVTDEGVDKAPQR